MYLGCEDRGKPAQHGGNYVIFQTQKLTKSPFLSGGGRTSSTFLCEQNQGRTKSRALGARELLGEAPRPRPAAGALPATNVSLSKPLETLPA